MPDYHLPADFSFLQDDMMNHHQPLAQMPGGGDTKIISVNVADFIRTRDSLGSAFITLSTAVDKAVKAYIDHTNVVLAGDSSLNVSFLQQPFLQLAQTAQQALLQGPHPMAGLQPPMMANGALAGIVDPAGKDGKRKRAYKKRDPNAPKRPLTAYFRFLQEQRGSLSKEMANKGDGQPQKPGDLTKLATEKWGAMTEAQQKPYRDQYKLALKDYEKEVKEYKAAGGQVPVEPAGPTTVVAGPDAEEDDDDSSSDDSDSSSDDDEEEEEAPPPPPKPKTKKSAQASSSPERKRKSAATEDAPASKRSKKGKDEKEAPAPVPEPSSAKKDKKKKKKKTTEA